MNIDIRLSLGFYDHPKTKKLKRRLGQGGIEHLQRIWLWAANSHPSGNLTGVDCETLAIVANWDGDEKELCNALSEIGWLDGEEGSFTLHGWEEHQQYVIKSEARSISAQKAANSRWEKLKACAPHTDGMRSAYIEQTTGNAESCDSQCPKTKTKTNKEIHSASDDAPRISKADTFNLFWDAFAHKHGKGGAEKAWKAIPHMDAALLEKILDAARKEAAQRPALIASGRSPKWAQGWLNERRWEDEYDAPTVDTPKQEVDPRRATAMPIINEVAKEYGPWWQTGEETPEQYFEREEKMIQECLKRGCPEDIAREVQQ